MSSAWRAQPGCQLRKHQQQAQLEQQVQVSVLKTALDAQATGALALLQAMPAVMPLAPSGNLGTQVNLYV